MPLRVLPFDGSESVLCLDSTIRNPVDGVQAQEYQSDGSLPVLPAGIQIEPEDPAILFGAVSSGPSPVGNHEEVPGGTGDSRTPIGRSQIQSIVAIGETEVYDIETELSHKFFAEGILVHNCQELRTGTSGRYLAAKVLSKKAKFVMGLSATPIYNYGDEIFNVLDLIKPGCLSDKESFLREWCVQRGSHHHVTDPKALGSYLREAHLFLRRTRAEVGRELPPVNKIIHTVGFDEGIVRRSDQHARQLAQQILTGSFEEKGQASRDLDRLARQVTGISKAREVAQYVRILLEGGEPVILAGWHREVYKIWAEELAEFEPVFYTGNENEKQKEASRIAFTEGRTNLFIMSLRSGAGLDGLQERCRTVVFGELDWSPKVHDQLVGRADRDGQPSQVMVVYLVSDSGSDPIIINVLGVKSSQSRGITDPLAAQEEQFGDDSRIKLLAQHYLARKGEPMAI